jgi:drug/metabolite transporter (DMT)-like permease
VAFVLQFYVLIGVVTFLWGLSFPVIKMGLGVLDPFTFLWMRSACSAAIVFALIMLRRGPVMPPRGMTAFWVNAVLHNLMFIFSYHGAIITTAGRFSIFLYTQPLFFTALAAWFIPAERFGMRAVAGFAVAFGGIVLLFAEKLGTGGASSLLGDGLVIISAICWATQSLYLRMKLQGVDPFRITAWSQLVAVPIFLLFAFFRGAELPDMTNPVVLLSVGFNGFVGTGLVMVLWVVLLANYPPSRVSAFMFLTPVFGVFLSGLILLEPMSAFMLAGAALVAAGIYLVNTDKRRAS